MLFSILNFETNPTPSPKEEAHLPHHSAEQQFPVIFYFVENAIFILNLEPFLGPQYIMVGFNNFESTLS